MHGTDAMTSRDASTGNLTMNQEPKIDVVATALADRSRAAIVCALMDGRAKTAKELAYQARVSAQTASFHLQRLVEGGLLDRHRQGRNRYYYLAGADVAATIEALMAVAPRGHLRRHRTRAGESVMAARSCYDHVAGRLGVALADRFAETGALLSRGGNFSLTPYGMTWLTDIGLDVSELQASRRPLVRTCMDWTERRLHLAGALGAALFRHFLSEGWLTRNADSRALLITPKGEGLLSDKLGIWPASLLSEAAAEAPASMTEFGR